MATLVTGGANAAPVPRRGRAGRSALALAVALALAPAVVRAAPRPAAPPKDDVPPPEAVALVRRKCASCHAMPSAGGRGGWSRASYSMHVRRVPISKADWALVREYLGDDTAGGER